jgi:bacteriocin biosynthesis cyclodehydratase domain-containing protein
MLRLAPSHPPLWRSASTIQFGADDVARIEGVVPWQERLIDALQDGIPDAMLIPLAVGFGATAREAARFADEIAPVLIPSPAAASSGAQAAVEVEVPADLSFTETTALESGLRGAGLRVAAVRAWPGESGVLPVVLVAHRLVDPRRAARLSSADVPHLPVELSGDRVTVGPLVAPGRTACLSCLHSHRRDEDPRWPLLAAQLLGRAALVTDQALVLEAALLAARLLRSGPGAVTTSVAVSAGTSRRVWRAHRPHADCLCRSPAGNASADAPDARSIAPTTARGYARPA